MRFLKKKSEALLAFQNLVILLERQYGIRVSSLILRQPLTTLLKRVLSGSHLYLMLSSKLDLWKDS